MGLKKDYSITINFVDGWQKFIYRMLFLFVIMIIPISIGIIVDSSAIQWMGFVMTFIIIIVVAINTPSNRFKTVAEARLFLDKIEKGEDL